MHLRKPTLHNKYPKFKQLRMKNSKSQTATSIIRGCGSRKIMRDSHTKNLPNVSKFEGGGNSWGLPKRR